MADNVKDFLRNIEIENIIKQYFKDIGLIQTRGANKFFKEFNEIKNYCENFLKYNELNTSLTNILIFFKKGYQLKKCNTCGKRLTYNQIVADRNFCSMKCKLNNIEENEKRNKKRKLTCLEKYGVEHSSLNSENRKKFKETCLEKYGVDSYSKTNEFKEKCKLTNLEKYNEVHYSKTNEWRERVEQTCLTKYNSISFLSSKYARDKIKKTCIEKYGVDVISKSNTVKENYKKHSLEKCGFDNYEKVHAWELIQSYKDYIIPLFEKDEYENYHKIYKWKCVKCGNEFESHIHKTMHIEEFPYLPRCLNCYPHLFGISNSEKELVEFCKQYFPNLKENNRKLIKPLELDIVIDELKLAIEFNGSFYHSVQKDFGVPLGYHLNKVIKCNKKGYRLIHIWEDEWESNKDLIKQKLIDIFTNNETIDYNQKLDRSWYNNLEGDFEELSPEIIIRNGFEVENCGYLIGGNLNG